MPVLFHESTLSSNLNLRFFRGFFFGFSALAIGIHNFTWMRALPEWRWEPQLMLQWLKLGQRPPDLSTLLLAKWLFVICAGLAALGLVFRISSIGSFLFGMYLLLIFQSFGVPGRRSILMAFILFTFMVLGNRTDDWILRVVKWIWCLNFFDAGICKLYYSGWSWINGEQLSSKILWANVVIGDNLAEVQDRLWAHLILMPHSFLTLLAGGAMLLELCAPLALFSRTAALLIVPLCASMQIGIYIFMGLNFILFLPAYLVWVPWDRLYQKGAQLFNRYAIKQ